LYYCPPFSPVEIFLFRKVPVIDIGKLLLAALRGEGRKRPELSAVTIQICMFSLATQANTAEQVAAVLNCQPSDVRVLVAVKLLKPLGNPPPNSTKFFATLELLEQVKDRTWLAKATNALNQH
jgi:hypothetical protein